MHVKTTLVVTNTTLTQQWIDELKKFAPTLNVGMLYSPYKGATASKLDAGTLDVAVTTFNVKRVADSRYYKNPVSFSRYDMA